MARCEDFIFGLAEGRWDSWEVKQCRVRPALWLELPLVWVGTTHSLVGSGGRVGGSSHPLFCAERESTDLGGLVGWVVFEADLS